MRFSKLTSLLVVVLLVSLVVPALAQAADVIVYNAAGDDEVHRRFAALYERQTGRTVEFMRFSAGELSARVQAESRNPRADVAAGVAEEHLVVLRDKGLLTKLSKEPEALKFFPEAATHDHGYWYSYFNTVLGIGVNTEIFKQLWPELEMPKTWDDFLNPEFQGEFVMPNPALSGTAYTFLVGNVLRHDDKSEAWDYLNSFAKQVGLITASGVAPSRMVAIGEFVFGVTFAHDAARNIRAGFPMEFVVPGKTASSTGNIAVVKDGPNGLEAAEHFINWYLGVDAQQLHTDLRLEASMHSEVILPSGLPKFEDLELVHIDSDWAAQQKPEILENWEKAL